MSKRICFDGRWLQFSIGLTSGWVRFGGAGHPGVHWKWYRFHPPLPSERFGYVRWYRLFGWGFSRVSRVKPKLGLIIYAPNKTGDSK